jgi:HSP20 family protein
MTRRREHPLARLAQDFDALFGMLGAPLSEIDRDFGTVRLWDFDVTENEKEIVVRAEVPGFEEKEIDVQINRDTLTIKAEKELKGDGQQEYRSFFRAITLPPGIDSEKTRATYRNGVLELHIPRAPGAQPKRIAIEDDKAGMNEPGRQSATNPNGAGAASSSEQGQQSDKQAAAKAKK